MLLRNHLRQIVAAIGATRALRPGTSLLGRGDAAVIRRHLVLTASGQITNVPPPFLTRPVVFRLIAGPTARRFGV